MTIQLSGQQVAGVQDRPQGRAKLVRQHGQEAIPPLQGLVRLLRRPAAFGDVGGDTGQRVDRVSARRAAGNIG